MVQLKLLIVRYLDGLGPTTSWRIFNIYTNKVEFLYRGDANEVFKITFAIVNFISKR